MKGFYVQVLAMDVAELQKFVQQHMLSIEQIMAAADEAKIPAECDQCNSKLIDFALAYLKVSSEDQTIFFDESDGVTRCVQYGSGCCGELIKYPLRRIIQQHIAAQLEEAKCECETFEV